MGLLVLAQVVIQACLGSIAVGDHFLQLIEGILQSDGILRDILDVIVERLVAVHFLLTDL